MLLTQAAIDRGVDAVVAAIASMASSPRPCRRGTRAERRAREFLEVLSAELEERTARAVADGGAHEVLTEIPPGKLNPYSAARSDALDDPASRRAIRSTTAARNAHGLTSSSP